MTLKELMTNAIHEYRDDDHDKDFHVARRIVRQYDHLSDTLIIQEVAITRISLGNYAQ